MFMMESKIVEGVHLLSSLSVLYLVCCYYHLLVNVGTEVIGLFNVNIK